MSNASDESARVVAFEVVRDGDALALDWSLDRPAPVRVGIGASSDPDSHRVLDHAPADVTTLRLADLPEGRHYVSVTPEGGRGHVAAERRLPFVGAGNFRDIGGYRS